MMKELSTKPTIKLSPRTFGSYVDVENRNYSLVIELTSLGGSFSCPTCRELHSEFELVARSYLATYGPVNSATFLEKPLIFAHLDYSEATVEYFRKFHLQTVPHYAVVPASTGSFQALQQFESTSVTQAEDLTRLIQKATKINIAISRPIWPQLLRGAAFILSAFVVVRYILPALYARPTHPMLAFGISMAVFFISMMGLVFNLIRTPPWMGSNRANGDPEYIMNGSRSQYVSEGVIIASLMSVVALAHVLINHLGSLRVKQQSPMTRALFWLVLGALLVALNWLWGIFLIKYGFYPYKFHYQTPAIVRQFTYPMIPF